MATRVALTDRLRSFVGADAIDGHWQGDAQDLERLAALLAAGTGPVRPC